MHWKEEILTENHATPMVSEIHTKLSITEENSNMFMNSVLWKAKTKPETSSLRNLKIVVLGMVKENTKRTIRV